MSLKPRDFVYLDVERVKSIVSQLEEGVILESKSIELSGKSSSKELEAGLFNLIKGTGNSSILWENQIQETKTLHDHVYNKVESILIEQELLVQVPGEVDTKSSYSLDISRNNLSNTSYVLLEAYVNFLDFSNISQLIEKFNEIGEFIGKCSTLDPTDITTHTKKRSSQKEKIPTKGLMLNNWFIKGFKEFIDLFYKDNIIIRAFPLESHPDFRFSGNLVRNYLRSPIWDISFKYGTFPNSKWYIFAQIAAIPSEDAVIPLIYTINNPINESFSNIFESVRNLEQSFLTISYPEIAIIPIAIYRQ